MNGLLQPSILDRGNAEDTDPALRLGDLHASHRTRLITPLQEHRRDPVAMSVEMLRQCLHTHPIHPGRTTVGFHLSVGDPEILLREYHLHQTLIQHCHDSALHDDPLAVPVLAFR